jgi:hypothetical protein
VNRYFVLGLVLLAGCTMKTRSIPDSGIMYAHANYTVMGSTSAKDCGVYVFGIDFPHLFSNTGGSASAAAAGDPLSALLGALTGGGGAEESRALYEALGKMPEATDLYRPRTESSASGILIMGRPIFGKRCAKVTARGVQIGSGPVPNAQ